jgi:hypothetical protein
MNEVAPLDFAREQARGDDKWEGLKGEKGGKLYFKVLPLRLY